jgi:hypothetical protein
VQHRCGLVGVAQGHGGPTTHGAMTQLVRHGARRMETTAQSVMVPTRQRRHRGVAKADVVQRGKVGATRVRQGITVGRELAVAMWCLDGDGVGAARCAVAEQ